MTVVLSSHLIADVERVCDHLVLLSGGRVQLSGDIDELLDDHRLLVGPADDAAAAAAAESVVSTRHAGREIALLVRSAGPQPVRVGWRAERLTLEELVVAYMSNPKAGFQTAPPTNPLEVAS
jgi:ABC-2 type transport system ATP-binding protein